MATIKNYGDITKINGAEVEITDVVIGGSPCQDLSVAGLRKGLEGERSGLFMEQIRLIKEMREHDKQRTNRGSNEHIRPRYMVWENVCGAFSSNNGEDFRTVLEETCKVADENAYVPGLTKGQKWANAGCIMGDGYSVAWRVHDAQFWGVPQRRKRICVLADYGGATAPEILFELLGETDDPESYKIVTDIREQSRPEVQTFGKGLSGNTEQGKQEGQGTPRNVENSLGTASTSGGIKTYDVRISSEGTKNQRAHCYETDRSRALDTGGENPDSNHGGVAVVGCDLYTLNTVEQHAVAYGISAYDSNAMKSPNPHSGVYEADTSRTLDLNGGSPACNQGGVAVVYRGDSITSPVNGSNPKPDDPCHTLVDDGRNYIVQAFDGLNNATSEEVSPTLMCQRQDVKNIPSVAYGLDRASFNQGQNAKFGFSVIEEQSPTITAKGPGGVFTGG